jgi:hypothetical protein
MICTVCFITCVVHFMTRPVYFMTPTLKFSACTIYFMTAPFIYDNTVGCIPTIYPIRTIYLWCVFHAVLARTHARTHARMTTRPHACHRGMHASTRKCTQSHRHARSVCDIEWYLSWSLLLRMHVRNVFVHWQIAERFPEHLTDSSMWMLWMTAFD